MALSITPGYSASSAEVWTPTKQNLSTVPVITLAQDEFMARQTAGTGSVEALTVAQVKVRLAIVPADVLVAASSFVGNATGGAAAATSMSVATAKTLLAIAQADVAGLTTSSTPTFQAVFAQHTTNGVYNLLTARNSSALSGAVARLIIGNDTTASAFDIRVHGSTHANANKTWIYTGGAYDLALGVNGAQNLTFAGATGIATFSAQVNAPTFNATSARRFKKNIRTLKLAGRLQKIRPVRFDWRDSSLGHGSQVGFIAEEMKKIFPGVVRSNCKGLAMGINYNGLTAVAIAGLQELAARVAKLERKAR